MNDLLERESSDDTLTVNQERIWKHILSKEYESIFFENIISLLNHSTPLVSFYTPRKHQKIFHFLVISGGKKRTSGMKWVKPLTLFNASKASRELPPKIHWKSRNRQKQCPFYNTTVGWTFKAKLKELCPAEFSGVLRTLSHIWEDAFCENSYRLLSFNYFHKTLHFRCLTFWIRLWISHKF